MEAKSKFGRPKLPPEERKTKRIQVTFSQNESKALNLEDGDHFAFLRKLVNQELAKATAKKIKSV